jgi:carbamoyltransferase
MSFCPKVKEHYKDLFPAAVHIDGTARVQTVTREQNQFLYDILTLFAEKTGAGVLLNTSLNTKGGPIVSTYKDALTIYDDTQLDALYLDRYYLKKKF